MATSSAETQETQTETALLHLPNEIVEMILLDDRLTHSDLGRMACVCMKWRDVCYSNELWKQKLKKRYTQVVAF